MDTLEWLEVARGAGDDDRALDRGGGQHRQLSGTRGGHTIGDQAFGDQIGPAGEGRRRAVDDRCRLILLVRVAGLHGHRDNGTTGAVIRADQLPAVVGDEVVENIETALCVGDSGGDVFAGVIDCLAEQLSAATG